MFTAGGDEFDVKAFLREFSVPASDHWVRGSGRRNGRLYEFSGFSIVASKADFDAFDTQVADVIQFIDKNSHWLKTIAKFPGVEHASLDFGMDMPEGATPMVRFPPALMSAAGNFGLWLEASLYYTSDNEPRS